MTTSNTLAVSGKGNSQSALALMASRLGIEPTKLVETLKATCIKNATNEELMSFVLVAQKYNLDPLTRQIYAFPSKGGIVPVVSVDGWLHLINSHQEFDGIEFEYLDDEQGKPISCTAIVHRKDRNHATRVTEFFAECFRATEPWKQFPKRMLRHKVIKESARIAFGISGITDEDEARDIQKNAEPVIQKPIFRKKSAPAPVEVEITPVDVPSDWEEQDNLNMEGGK